MKASHISDEYENGVEEFLQFVQRNAQVMHGKYFCSCVKWGNGRQHSVNDIRSHLIHEGIIPNYTKWIWHGELPDMTNVPQTDHVDVQIKDCLEDMISNLGQQGFRHAHAPYYEKIQSDSNKPLYSRSTSFTRLSTMLALVNLKARFGWSAKASLNC